MQRAHGSFGSLQQHADTLDGIASLIGQLPDAATRLIQGAYLVAERIDAFPGEAFVWQQRRKDGAALIALVHLTPWNDIFSGFIAPSCPARTRVARKQFEIGARRTCLDEIVLLVGFARMSALAGFDHVDLRAARRKRAHGTMDAKQQHLGDVAEIEANAAPVGSAVLAALRPDEIADVTKTPCLHDFKPIRQ